MSILHFGFPTAETAEEAALLLFPFLFCPSGDRIRFGRRYRRSRRPLRGWWLARVSIFEAVLHANILIASRTVESVGRSHFLSAAANGTLLLHFLCAVCRASVSFKSDVDVLAWYQLHTFFAKRTDDNTAVLPSSLCARMGSICPMRHAEDLVATVACER